VDVGVFSFVEADEALNDRLRLLRRRRVVEVNQRFTVHLLMEDREVFANLSNIERGHQTQL